MFKEIFNEVYIIWIYLLVTIKINLHNIMYRDVYYTDVYKYRDDKNNYTHQSSMIKVEMTKKGCFLYCYTVNSIYIYVYIGFYLLYCRL